MSETQVTLFPDPTADLVVPDLSRLVTSREFARLAQRGGDAAGVVVAKDFHNVEISKESDGQFRFTLTSGSVDRDSDVIEQGGLDWTHLDKNPIWLWSHDSHGTGLYPPQIGVITERKTLKTRTDVRVLYVPKEVNPLGEAVRQLHEFRASTKALQDRGGAASIGMLPHEFHFDKELGGVRFVRGEPLEGSDVAIGSNRDALLRAKSAGVDLGPIAEWAEAVRKIVSPDQRAAQGIVETLEPVRGLVAFAAPQTAASDFGPVVDRLEKLAEAVARLEQSAETCSAPPPTPVPEATGPSFEELQAQLLHRAELAFIARTGQPFPATKPKESR